MTSGSLAMTGGTITDNTAANCGGAVYLNDGSSFILSGTPVITGNTQTDGTTDDNVYLYSG